MSNSKSCRKPFKAPKTAAIEERESTKEKEEERER
jgi:hypothetical protein